MPAVPAIDTAARRCAAALATSMLLPLAACTADSEDAPRGDSGAARDLRTAERDQVAEGGTLRWAIDEMPSTLNVFQPDATRATERIAGATLPALFTLDSRARPQRNADYLADARVTTTGSRQTVVYTLNPEAEWSGGRAIGAGDFKAQWKALNGENSAYWTARNAGYKRIAKVTRGAEPHQVKVVFSKPYADWQALFTPLYPKAVMGEAKAFNDGARSELPASGGPFRAEKFDAENDDTVTLVRNRAWWGDRARLKRIELPVVPRGEREKALAAGELDLAAIPPAVAGRIGAARTSDGKGDGKGREGARKEGSGGRAAPGSEGKNGEAEPEGGPGNPLAPGLHGTVTHERAVAAVVGWVTAGESDKQRAAAEAARRNLSGYAVRRALDPAYTQLALNGGSGPLSDERVRRALARALDREDLAERALGGLGLPGEPLGSHLRMRDQHGYHDNSDALGGRDVASAQALLAEAGWEGQVAGQEGDEPVDAKEGNGPKEAEQAERPGDAGNAGNTGDTGRNSDKGAGEDEDAGKNADAPAGTSRAAGAGEGAVAVPVGAAEAARIQGVPLSLAPDAAVQRAGLLSQAARARTAEAKDSGKGKDEKTARAAERAAEDARARAEEMRLLSGGSAATVRTKNGKPLALRFLVPAGPGSGAIQDTGRRIAGMLNEIGVRTDVERVGDETLFRDRIAAGDYDLALYSWPASAFPATDARPIFAKPVPGPDGSLAVQQNWTRVGTYRIDQLLDEAAAELDEEKREDLLRRADARIWAAAGSVPLYQRPQLVAAKNRLANAGAFGFETPRYQDIGWVR